MLVSLVAKRSLGLNSYTRIACFLSNSAKDARTKELLDKIIRIDHAGEFGAKRIYQGQIAVLKDTPEGPLIKVQYCSFSHQLQSDFLLAHSQELLLLLSLTLYQTKLFWV